MADQDYMRQPATIRRLGGALAPGTSIAASGSAAEDIPCTGYNHMRVRVLPGGTGTPAIDATPYAQDGTTKVGTGLPTTVTPGVATEGMLDLPLKGERLVEVAVSETVGSNPVTITWVDIFLANV